MSREQQGQPDQQQVAQTQQDALVERVVPAEPSDEEKRLVMLFDEMEGKQLEFLDESGKGIIERIITLLGVLFAVTAFGSDFPPAYLKGNMVAKALVIVTLVFYLLSLWMSTIAIQPRSYQRFYSNLGKMRATLDAMVEYKIRWLGWARWLFALGSVALAALIIAVIWGV